MINGMRVVSVINLKGGVGKSISAINIAYDLAMEHNARVLLIDNDKQGNTSKFFGVHSYDAPSLADVLTVKGFEIVHAIKSVYPQKSRYKGGLCALPANMNLIRANKEILLDSTRPQQTRLKKALEGVITGYNSAAFDYAVIDNAPDLNMSVINALAASDDVLVPVKIDNFAFEGLDVLREQINDVREFNPDIRVAGVFVTMYARNNVNAQGAELLHNRATEDFPTFSTVIRKTVKVDESTFAGKPLSLYAPKSNAARDYSALVNEYLGFVTENSTNGRA